MRTSMQTAAVVLALVLVLGVSPGAQGAVTMYSSRAAFNGAAPGLPVDTFGPTLQYTSYPLDYYFHTRPVSAATNDSLFPSGSILPGVTISTQSPVFESQAIKIEPIAGGNQVGAATFEDTLVLDFSPPVSAVGFDLLGHVYSHPLFNGTVALDVYNGSTRLSSSNPPVNGSTFFGITSPTANITRVTVMFEYDADACTFIANLAFGSPSQGACPGDFNNSGQTTVQDVFDFLGAYFGGSMSADFNRSGQVTVQDIFDFLMAWFGGGC